MTAAGSLPSPLSRTSEAPILLRTDADGVATLTLNRPQARNALSMALMGALQAALDAIPPAVLVAVTAPSLLATGWRETVASAITIVAATRPPLIGTVAVGVGTTVLPRHVLPG